MRLEDARIMGAGHETLHQRVLGLMGKTWSSGEFPMRPSRGKCAECDFRKICSKQKQEFVSTEIPSPIQIPQTNGITVIRVRSFSDVE